MMFIEKLDREYDALRDPVTIDRACTRRCELRTMARIA